MRWRQVLVAWVVFLLLAAEYWFVERRAPPTTPGHPVRQRFLPVEPDQLREIRLIRGGRTVVSARRGTAWEVIEPAGAGVPPDLIAAFANAITGAEEIDVMGAGADPHAFGFDEQAGRIVMVMEHGDPLEVVLGGTNPTGTAIYARRGAASQIVLIGRNVRYYEDLIFHALPAAHPPAVDQDVPVGG